MKTKILHNYNATTITRLSENNQAFNIDIEFKFHDNPYYTGDHRHTNFYEIEFFISGSGIYAINGKPNKYQKGAAFLTTPFDVHSLKVEAPTDYYMINFSETSVLPEYLNILYNTKLTVVQFENIEKITTYCKLLFEEISEKNHFQENNKKMLLNLIIAEIIKNAKIGRFNNPSALINEIIKYIRIHITEPLSLEELAKTFNISPSYLSILFKKNMNETFKRYVIDLRLSLAINLLLQTEMTITEICYQCGFSTIGNFLRRFKEKFKVTPNEYRKNYKTE